MFFLRLLVVILALAWPLGAWFSEAHAQCDYVKVINVSSNLNIRPDPNTSRAAVGTLPPDACAKVVGSTNSGENISGNTTWYKITYNGVTGWISGYYAQCSSCGGPPPECSAGQTKSCYSGPSGTAGKGECKAGTQSCQSGKWGACSGEIKPSAESCNGQDDNCDGSVDEGNPGGGGACSTGTPGPCGQGIHQCKSGKLTCVPNQQGGTPEICDNQDNDCNGQIDDGLSRNCYSGPPNTNGVGPCKGGNQICIAGAWGKCQGEATPASQEICDNKIDDNCDGQVDEGCSSVCQSGQSRPCYNGTPNTSGVGICKAGNQSCQNGAWGTCEGEVKPAASEQCGNGQDDNCNGQIDEGCNQPQECEDKDGDGYGVGKNCKGAQDCNDNDKNIHPGAPEQCGNGIDEDCDGKDLECGKIEMGVEGCRKPSDCVTNLCVRLGETYRCSTPCTQNTDCPPAYTCVDGKACWPSKHDVIPPSDFVKACKNDSQCPNGQRCDNGFCKETKGCGCQTTQPFPLLSYFWLLFVLLLLLHRKKSHKLPPRPR